jgi:hypothetical protein
MTPQGGTKEGRNPSISEWGHFKWKEQFSQLPFPCPGREGANFPLQVTAAAAAPSNSLDDKLGLFRLWVSQLSSWRRKRLQLREKIRQTLKHYTCSEIYGKELGVVSIHGSHDFYTSVAMTKL